MAEWSETTFSVEDRVCAKFGHGKTARDAAGRRELPEGVEGLKWNKAGVVAPSADGMRVVVD